MVCFRHGNTFEPGEPVVCAGRQAGLPLVAAGRRQAAAAGHALAAAGVLPQAVVASPRLRAAQFATELCAAAGWQDLCVQQDARLDELDYGPWTGRTRAAIVAAGGGGAVDAWDHRGAWPTGAGFGGDEATLRRGWQTFVAHWRATGVHTLVAVSHAGCMRYLPPLATGTAPEADWPGPHRVRCGHATVLSFAKGAPRLLGADLSPQALTHTLQQRHAP